MLKFKELYELWRKDNLFTQAVQEAHTMLESTFLMFNESIRSLREKDDGEMSDEIYLKDQEVNKFEREVRYKILKHLAITSGSNLIPGLILTSIIIDIERIGDYTKNIMDLAIAHPKKLNCSKYEKALNKIEKAVTGVFQKVVEINETSDKDAAQQLINDNKGIVKRCDEILLKLINEEKKIKSAGIAVITALYIRYLKRITAHLINILTSVTSPFERIGFLEEEQEEGK